MKIKEIKTSCDSSKLHRHALVCDSDLKGIPYPIPGHDGGHWCTIISGKPKSGKSTLALGMLSTKGKDKVYRGKYDHIIIFVPQHSLSSLKHNPFEDLDKSKTFNELTTDNLNNAFEQIKQNSEAGETTLLYLDDMASDLKQNMRTQELFNRLCFNRRHLKVSIMFLTQTYKSIPVNCRKTASHLILYRTNNKMENQAVFDEVMFMDKNDIDELLEYVYDKPFQFLFIDVNNGALHKCFNPLLISD